MGMVKWDASDYASNSSAQQTWAKELISKLNLRGDEHVLDIGSGDGKNTAEIGRRIPQGQVLGIDYSQEMVNYAQAQYQKREFPNLSFQHLDVQLMDYDSTFDVIFSNACLHWVKDHRTILKKIGKALKPGGKILLQMGGKGNAAGIIDEVQYLLNDPRWGQFFKGFEMPYGFYDTIEYKAWLAEAGLVPSNLRLIPKDMTQKGAEGLAGWIRTTWLPYTQRIPEKMREDFIDIITRTYIARHPLDAVGKVNILMVRLEVAASKPRSV